MKKNPYLPDTDAERVMWLINFNHKPIGISGSEVIR